MRFEILLMCYIYFSFSVPFFFNSHGSDHGSTHWKCVCDLSFPEVVSIAVPLRQVFMSSLMLRTSYTGLKKKNSSFQTSPFRIAQPGVTCGLPNSLDRLCVPGDAAVTPLALVGGAHHCLMHLAESARCFRTPGTILVPMKEHSAGCHYAYN